MKDAHAVVDAYPCDGDKAIKPNNIRNNSREKKKDGVKTGPGASSSCT